MAAKQLAELRGPPERVGRQLACGQRDRRLDPPVSLAQQMGPRREGAGVQLGKAIERGGIGVGGEPQADRPLPGRTAMMIQIAIGSSGLRHDRNYGCGRDLRKMLLSPNRS
ncbi:MAG TPA: hypothetical protein VLB79_07370 [Solirubrobacterales bacterium]|nr:hypothetical protein [Solirubrobacterales bacterium]